MAKRERGAPFAHGERQPPLPQPERRAPRGRDGGLVLGIHAVVLAALAAAALQQRRRAHVGAAAGGVVHEHGPVRAVAAHGAVAVGHLLVEGLVVLRHLHAMCSALLSKCIGPRKKRTTVAGKAHERDRTHEVIEEDTGAPPPE